MPNKAWFLPVGCFPVIVKLSAVTRLFPGGLKAFETGYSPIRKREVHLMVMTFTAQEAQAKLAELEAHGLMPGVDVAAADDLGQPWIDCVGIAFRRHRGSEYLRWMVDECEAAEAVVEDPLPPAWIALVGPDGNQRYSLQEHDAGLVIAARQPARDAEAGVEYLCAFSGRWGFSVGLYRYGTHRTFELAAPMARAEVSDCSETMIRAALAACRWPDDSWEGVQYSLQRLAELKGRASGAASPRQRKGSIAKLKHWAWQ